jgi:NAD(P)-dependent dehydrogenase (short-subunit alcohol dehydrogenase family)
MHLKTVDNLFNLKGRIALITGAAGNLGREICKALSGLGVDLILVDHQDSNLSELENYINESTKVKVYKHYCDLENESSRSELIANILLNHKKLNILINNAAFVGSSDLDGWLEKLAKQSLNSWRRAIEVNLTAPFHISQKLEPLLNKTDGASIINIGSIYGIYAPDFNLYKDTDMGNPAAYGVSKAGLNYLTKWLSTSMAPNIRVNSINPGGILRNQDKKFIKRYIEKTPLKRMATERDLTGMVAYLSSDMSSYVTGQIFEIDGGWGVW